MPPFSLFATLIFKSINLKSFGRVQRERNEPVALVAVVVVWLERKN